MKTIRRTDLTTVIYRRWRDTHDVIALFPTIQADELGRCASYMHVGQHSAADYNGVISATDPAHLHEPDTTALHRELQAIGYKLKVRSRRGQR